MEAQVKGHKYQVQRSMRISPLLPPDELVKAKQHTKAIAFAELGAQLESSCVYMVTILDAVHDEGHGDPLYVTMKHYVVSILATEVLSNGTTDPNT